MACSMTMKWPGSRRSARAEALLRSFVEHAKASGEVAAALQRNHVQGVSVAPPARG